jgi:5-(carboxyamino)imidazole ribonucleotide synthase
MQQFASKRQQKILLDELKLPTARFEIFKDADRNIASWFQTLAPAFPNGYVLKWGEGGYDGKGVLRSDRADNATQIKFCNEALAKKATVYAEELIPFKRELAIVGVHSRNGDFLTYPLVFSEQDRGICSLVSGPADVDTALEHTAQKLTQTLAKRAGLIGSFALELFETINGALIINEIAPRVHNSGHYSQDACSISQFENHWLALLGLPPQEPVVAAAFVMVNILGREDNAVGVDFPQIPTGFRLHWYGKELGKPRRKLGHLNGWSNAPADRGRLEECAVAWKQSWLKG